MAIDVRKYGPKSEFVQNLLIQVYSPQDLQNPADKDIQELNAVREIHEQRKQRNLGTYQQALEAFIQSQGALVQKILGVMTFFDHATKGVDGKFAPGLIVSNCLPAKFQDDGMKNALKTFLGNMGNETDGKKLWFGILPDVLMGEDSAPAQKTAWNADLDLDDEPASASEPNGTDLIVAKSLLDWCNQAGVLTVFNFNPVPANSFAGFTLDTLERMENALQERNIDYSHAVCSFPNFTVMREGPLDLGDGFTISAPAIYISASYVAAGLIAASQQSQVIEARDKGNDLAGMIIETEVNTRIDLENALINHVLSTKFNRENSHSWPADIIPALVKNRFGFVFCSEFKRNEKTHKPEEHTYILQASIMEKGDDGLYLPVYWTLTQDFINNYIRQYYSQGMDAEDAEKFLKTVQVWQNDAEREANSKKLNLVLRKGETIQLGNEEEPTFNITMESGKGRVKPRVKANKKAGDKK